MATEEKIRRAIQGIACRKRNVTLDEIAWVMNQLKAFGPVRETNNDQQRMYSFMGTQFGIATHLTGSKQLKSVYVKAFLSAMSDTGWYED